VVIEYPLAAIYENVIAGESGGWFQPDHLWTAVTMTFEESVGQDVASPAGKEHPVRQCPPHCLIVLPITRRTNPIHAPVDYLNPTRAETDEQCAQPQNRRLGCTRVSTYGQTLDAQLEQLRLAGCTNRNIRRKKVTGARADRREFLRMLDRLGPGDAVTVTRIDRLACSTFDLFGTVKQIVDAKAQFRSLAEPWADTGTSTGRLMLAVLGGLADVERDLIRTRTAEGRSRAKARGQPMGRPPSLTPAQQKEVTRRRATLQELADNYDRSISTMRRATRAAYSTTSTRKPPRPNLLPTGMV
jgi:DNA invertase Pin-like site-specific DNA recombinase